MEKAESSSLSTSGSNLLPTTLNNNDDNALQKSFLNREATNVTIPPLTTSTNDVIPPLTTSTNDVIPFLATPTSKFEQSDVPRRKLRVRKSKAGLDASGFLANFNPVYSEREKQKAKKFRPPKAAPFYDSKGILIEFQKDLCDCLEEECPGCHFPCPKCRSCKCGHECRQNRKWQYESLEVNGQPGVLRENSYVVKR